MIASSRIRNLVLSFILLLPAALLTACGNGSTDPTGTIATEGGTTPSGGTSSSGSNPSPTSSGTGSNAALTLSGTGAATVTAGTTYSFVPSVGASAGSVTFSIVNKPTWATFSTSTGQLSGAPAASDAGSYGSITISASNGTSSATLAPFTITVIAAATGTGTATLSWTPPTQNTDGTALTDLAGYNVYYGSNSTALTNRIQLTNPGLTSYTVTGLTSGTTYFAVTAYDSAGVESAQSNVGSKTI